MNPASQQLFVFLAVLAVVALVCYRRPWQGSTTAHGTARWATEGDLKRAGMLGGGDGLILGRTPGGGLIRMLRYVHLAVFAATGAGKGVSLVVPWLLSYRRGSVLVLDLKGELFRLTAAVRRGMGQTIVRLDPFGVCGPGADTFNLLDLVGGDVDCADDARALSEALVIRTGEEKDPHFNDQAANLIAALLALILAEVRPEERNLRTFRELICDEQACNGAVAVLRKKGGVFARMAGVIEQLRDQSEGGGWSKEGASVMSTVHRHTTFLDSEAVLRSVAGNSTFDARELLKGTMTIYLVLPPHQLEAQARWLRLVIASLIRLIGREGAQENK